MKTIYNLFLIGMFSVSISYAQNKNDSTRTLPEIIVTAYPSKLLLLNSASSVTVIQKIQIQDYTNQTLVPVMNSVAGLRMEERSPGSYRLSIRGSLLRSPFGIRNIKIYLNEFPLTDAGGNTYLNLINANSINSIQILKGPEGSMFGANTGGVILLDFENKTDTSLVEASLKTGSFGLFDEQVSIHKKWKYYSLNINQDYQYSNGYRQNSALKRNYVQTLQKWDYKKNSFKILLLGSQLHYATPGGLTLSQSIEDPRQARPATKTFPGALEQKSGVYNSTIYTGISNEIYLLPNLRHVLTLICSYTDFKNPFITNYEKQKELTTGLRTYFEIGKKKPTVHWKWDFGFEWQETKSKIANYDNISGNIGEIQSSDNLIAIQHFIFNQFTALINNRLELEAALSLNNYKFKFENNFPNKENRYTTKKLNKQLMPRIGISYRLIDNFVWRISASEGYSPPTLAELRPSDNIIYSGLQSEYGWNYETGFRFKSKDHRWNADMVVFKFNLKNAIIRKTNDAGNEYFVNAGSTNQMGLEFQLFISVIKNRLQGVLRGLDFQNSFTYYDFTFTDYSIDQVSYSGNIITGVPKLMNVSSLKLFFPKRFNLFISNNYTSSTPLNDGNSVYSSSYQIVGSKLSWAYKHKDNNVCHLFVGVENIFNVSYSLGNDINAIGNRYYNPAPQRNYYGGIKVDL